MRLGILFSAALFSSVTAQKPVEKVTSLLENLIKKVRDDGKREAEEYDKFSCFCKDEVDTKQDAIKQGGISRDELQSSIATKTAARDVLDTEIATLNDDLTKQNNALADLRKQRSADEADYLAKHSALSKGVDSVERAIAQIKATKGSDALIALNAARRDSLTAISAAGYSMKHASNLLKLLEQVPASAPEGVFDSPDQYDFHSDSVVSVLETLLENLKTKRTEAQTADAKNNEDFKLKEQAKLGEIATSEESRETKTKESAGLTRDVSGASNTLAQVQAVLLDDKDYLATLSTNCEAKAKEWDARSKVRSDELLALSQAVAVMKGTVAGLDVVNRRRNPTPSLPKASYGVALISLSSRKLRRPLTRDDARITSLQAAVKSLRQSNESIRSRDLEMVVAAAATSGDDAFATVKKMIEDLVTKLLDEASTEATHKGWCDTQLGRVKQTQKEQQEAHDRAQAEADDISAKIQQLEKDTRQLNEEIDDLKASAAKATTLRATEKDNNASVERDALEGSAAVKKALEILDTFYRSAKKQALIQVALRTKTATRDEPFADGAYEGAQGEAWGILGFLETIGSDFDRSAKEAKESETAQQAAFDEFIAKNKESLGRKQTAVAEFVSEKTTAESDLATKEQDARTAQDTLDQADEEYQKLKPACLDDGVTPEDRKAKRQEEVDALKEALQILQATSFNGASSPFKAPFAP